MNIYNIALVLAHSIQYEIEQQYPDCKNILNVGNDPAAPSVNESTGDMLQAYIKYLPDLLKSTSAQVLPTEQAQLAASQQISPAYSKLQADIFSQIAPGLNKTGQDIARSNAMSSAESDKAVLAGPGRDLVTQGLETAKIADPEYYKTREATGGQLSNLLGSFNLNGLSGGERAEAERSINRGNAGRGLGNNEGTLNTVSNAMNFGNAFQQKRQNLQSAIGSATAFLGNGAKSGVDVFQQATGRPSVPNQGAAQFLGNNQNIGQTAQGMGLNLLGQIGQNQQSAMNINANRRDTWDRVAQAFGSV